MKNINGSLNNKFYKEKMANGTEIRNVEFLTNGTELIKKSRF